MRPEISIGLGLFTPEIIKKSLIFRENTFSKSIRSQAAVCTRQILIEWNRSHFRTKKGRRSCEPVRIYLSEKTGDGRPDITKAGMLLANFCTASVMEKHTLKQKPAWKKQRSLHHHGCHPPKQTCGCLFTAFAMNGWEEISPGYTHTHM